MTGFTRKPLACSQTLGEKLIRARKRNGADLRLVERETKVSFKYLSALEHGRYQDLPAPVYVRGFLTRYAQYLNTKPEPLLECYEVERLAYESLKPVHRTLASRLGAQSTNDEGLLRPAVSDEWLRKPASWIVTPGTLWGSLISLVLVAALGYVWFQVKSFAAAPPLEITTPSSALMEVEQVTIQGTTDPTAELEINSLPVAVGEDGKFSQPVKLSEGMNRIEITAINASEKTTTKVVELLAELKTPVTNQ